jgi:hypothetical protein
MKIRMDSCWIISRIARGSMEQAERLLDSAELIRKLFDLFEIDHSSVKREICCVFSNLAVSSLNAAIVFDFYRSTRIIRYYFDILATAGKHHQSVVAALHGLHTVLGYADILMSREDRNPIAVEL